MGSKIKATGLTYKIVRTSIVSFKIHYDYNSNGIKGHFKITQHNFQYNVIISIFGYNVFKIVGIKITQIFLSTLPREYSHLCLLPSE